MPASASVRRFAERLGNAERRDRVGLLDAFVVGTDDGKVELGADPHGVGVNQFLGNEGATVAALLGHQRIQTQGIP